MTTWITDDRGNRCSVECWGSEEAARRALDSLKDCRDCTNCSDCSNCSHCSDCSNCSNCSHCSDCSDCSNCSRCSACSDCLGCSRCSDCLRCSGCSRVKSVSKPLCVGPFRSDGYQFVMGDTGAIHAGCRVFPTMAEAREHWQETRGGTPLGDETTLILDFLEAMAKLRARPEAC